VGRSKKCNNRKIILHRSEYSSTCQAEVRVAFCADITQVSINKFEILLRVDIHGYITLDLMNGSIDRGAKQVNIFKQIWLMQ